jgi:hypothetical protein
MLVYGASQFMLILLWLLDWAFWERRPNGEVRILDDGNDDENKGDVRRGPKWAYYMWSLCFLVAAGLGMFTSVGGTRQSTHPPTRPHGGKMANMC